ncbi:MAG: LLM class flavin-dependent oxidoreductase [Candidatus Bathyarchaeia archaeon]
MKRVGIGFFGNYPCDEMLECVKLAEKRGVHSAWMAEDYFFRDGFNPAAAFAAVTRRMKIGIGTVNPYTRHPALIAMCLATLDEISRGRMILGIGSSVRAWIEDQMGLQYRKPLTAVKESVEVIRAFLKGEPVTYRGEFFNVSNATLTFKPVRMHVPIYVAAMRKRGLQAAGALGDGVFLSGGSSVEYCKFAVANIVEGAKKAGRDPAKVDVAAYIYCVVSNDSKKAKESVKDIIASEFAFGDIFSDIIQTTGYSLVEVAPIADAYRRGNVKEAVKMVKDEHVEAFTAAGTAKECREKVEAYRSAGVKLPILMPVKGSPKRAVEAVGKA